MLATLFISEKNKKTSLIRFLVWCGITAFIALFGFVYEQFSHGVNSNYMWFAWIRPLIAGACIYAFLCFVPIKSVPGVLTESCYNLGVALFTMHSIIKGVLEIYGKTNDRMVLAYLILFLVFMISGVVLYVFGLVFFRKKETEK